MYSEQKTSILVMACTDITEPQLRIKSRNFVQIKAPDKHNFIASYKLLIISKTSKCTQVDVYMI